ncbi:MAG: hypothetical protein HY512_00700 [Candidatus Aenigmarchaeota archaeon]|nr:hypothetical protein [Candidatus Aenigmarchaeota archaeon]
MAEDKDHKHKTIREEIKHGEEFLNHLLHKHRKLKIHFSAAVVVLLIVIGTSAFFNFTFSIDNQNKAVIISSQEAVIENQTGQINSLGKLVQNQALSIANLTAFTNTQKVTIGAQQTELEKRGLYINTLLTNITTLTNSVKTKEAVINNLKDQLGQTESQVKTLEGQLTSTKSELSSSQQKVQSLTPVTKNYFVAAVSGSGGGVIVPMEVKFVGGTGIISIDVHNVEVSSTAQDSVRSAAIVAQQVTGVGLSGSDTTVSFVHGGEGVVSIDGPSAGAAITVTMIAAIQGKNMNSNVLMTGTINIDGTIGQIGGQQAKAEAAKAKGATKFLVPVGQLVNVTGLEVVEVANINQAVGLIVS